MFEHGAATVPQSPAKAYRQYLFKIQRRCNEYATNT
jgi:hypothetical protein